jgi:Family of unknown function (DUF5522)
MMDENEMYYTPGGLVVFTEQYLLARGYCCGNGCKHCPYNYKNVPEPRRTQLLTKRKTTIHDTEMGEGTTQK